MKTEAEIKRIKELMRYVPGTHPNDLNRPEDKKDGGDIIDPNARKKEAELIDSETHMDDGFRLRVGAPAESESAIGPQLLQDGN